MTVIEAANYGFELLLHPSYSPDSAPSDLFLFSKLKSQLYSHHFGNNEKIIGTADEFWEDQDSTFFLDGNAMLENGWTNFIIIKEN